MFPISADQRLFCFPNNYNQPITWADLQHIKEAETLADVPGRRLDERGWCQKLVDWCCLGPDYNDMTREADAALWRLLKANPDNYRNPDKLGQFERLRDMVTDVDQQKFHYLGLDRDEVRFSLSGVESEPVHFRAAPEGVPKLITYNLWNPTAQEEQPEAMLPVTGNLHGLAAYQQASFHKQRMLNWLARPATYMAMDRAIDTHRAQRRSRRMLATGMANPAVPAPANQAPLLGEVPQNPPTFTLTQLDNGLMRADISYDVIVGRAEISFLLSELPHPGAPIRDTMQCIYRKFTSTIGLV
ncbi:hypothetical protein [Pandoraea oxalativorans]|uniref:Uncharacterized protein n=1 Tax=Pandoraea oxalativorans TaxID=573737 RepID=A0A0G3IHU6_9BURK|nr:hypothetical protein [Pandoraea oxalativorans]AKK24750.1 hypothetical protein MB84_28520 [Pandoraea oxalativorans]